MIGPSDKTKSDSWYKQAGDAFNWFKVQASTGNPEAQFDLGYCYDLGLGVEVDWSSAVKWYLLAAEKGYLPAQRNLGGVMRKGKVYPKILKKLYSGIKKQQNKGMLKHKLI